MRIEQFSLFQDFEANNELKTKVIAFLEEVMHDPELLTQERKAAANIIRYLSVMFESRLELCVDSDIFMENNDIFYCASFHFAYTTSCRLLFARTLTQEDHGDNQITLEDVTQLVRASLHCSVDGCMKWLNRFC